VKSRHRESRASNRSDVTAVAACGVIAEAMLAYVLADALLESTGGDRLEDVKSRLAAHRERVGRYPRTTPHRT
jgi:chorismate synthase